MLEEKNDSIWWPYWTRICQNSYKRSVLNLFQCCLRLALLKCFHSSIYHSKMMASVETEVSSPSSAWNRGLLEIAVKVQACNRHNSSAKKPTLTDATRDQVIMLNCQKTILNRGHNECRRGIKLGVPFSSSENYLMYYHLCLDSATLSHGTFHHGTHPISIKQRLRNRLQPQQH